MCIDVCLDVYWIVLLSVYRSFHLCAHWWVLISTRACSDVCTDMYCCVLMCADVCADVFWCVLLCIDEYRCVMTILNIRHPRAANHAHMFDWSVLMCIGVYLYVSWYVLMCIDVCTCVCAGVYWEIWMCVMNMMWIKRTDLHWWVLVCIDVCTNLYLCALMCVLMCVYWYVLMCTDVCVDLCAGVYRWI